MCAGTSGWPRVTLLSCGPAARGRLGRAETGAGKVSGTETAGRGAADVGPTPRPARALRVAREGHRATRGECLAVGGQVGVAGLARLRVGLGPLALLGHQPAEAVFVDAQALVGRDLEGEVDREAVG